MNRPNLRVPVLIAAAVAVTAVATATVTAALTGDDSTLTQDQVDRLLSATTAPATTLPTTPSPAATATSEGDEVVATLIPGTVTVRCADGLATLVSWSPNPGYRSDDPWVGPAAQVSVRFENDASDADYKVTATCVDGVPQVVLGPDDHSGGGRGSGHDDD